MVHTLSVTLRGGFRAGVWALVGCTLAAARHMVVAMAGRAAVPHIPAVLFQTSRYAGLAYLLRMAWAVPKSTGAAADRGSPARPVRRGILLTVLIHTAIAISGRKAILSSPRLMTWMKRALATSFAGLGAKLPLEGTP